MNDIVRLPLRLSRRANAVSSLHGEVSRSMWTCLWPARSEEEVPMGHITNGIHVPSWLAPQMHQVYDRHLGVDWKQQVGEPKVWEGVDKINEGELWEVHQALKSRLLEFARRKAADQAECRGEPAEVVKQLRRALRPDALTIGFARRFATYKRSNLAFLDLRRLAEIINDPRQPVPFIFAGKAHPHDTPGKEIMQQINALARAAEVLGKVVYLEDDDINTCRHMVQGVDVWLNNPRRPAVTPHRNTTLPLAIRTGSAIPRQRDPHHSVCSRLYMSYVSSATSPKSWHLPG